MRTMSKFLLATTSVLALTGAAQAQQTLINQNVTGTNVLTSGNTSTLLNTSGFGSVTLQAFQDAVNKVNQGAAIYGGNPTSGTITQSISSAGSLSLTTNNTNAGFSTNGAQLVTGNQTISTVLNDAGLTLLNTAIATIDQNNTAAITSSQKNVLSAGYNTQSSGNFGIGQGSSIIQSPFVSTSGTITSRGNQSNDFNLNSTLISVVDTTTMGMNPARAPGSATVTINQAPGAINSTQTNFIDAGQASPTSIDPSITALNQTVTANVNTISGGGVDSAATGPASGSTLILAGASSSGKQVIGSSLDSFTVQNSARALTFGSTSASTGSGAYGSTSGGTGDVSITGSNQSVALNFNRVVAGTSQNTQNVNFGPTGQLFEQTATYGSTSTTASGVVIANATTGGFANFGAIQGSTSDKPINLAFAATKDGAASLTDIDQKASATLNNANVTGSTTGNLKQAANINTETISSGIAVGVGPQLSNFAGAVVQSQGPTTLSNVDQTSTLSSNNLTTSSVSADGLTLTQTGYQSKTQNFNPIPASGTVNPGLSSNVLIAGTSASTTLGSNASISGSTQSLSNTQNTFSATTSTGGLSGPAQLNITQGLTAASLNTAYGGDNLAIATAGNGGGNGIISDGNQSGKVSLNDVKVNTTSLNTQTQVNQTGAGSSANIAIAGNNTASVSGRTASITGYDQSYEVGLNTVSLGGTGAGNVTQSSGSATINTANTLTVTESSSSPFATATIGSLGPNTPSQSLTAKINSATIANGSGPINQTAGPVTSTLTNTATATSATSSASGITGLSQTTSQSINTSP